MTFCDKEEKKILHGQFSLSLNLLHLKGLTCTGEGSSKNKINLQLNKNTLLIIHSWKIPHYIFGITLDSYNQLAIRSTEITTHSFTLVWFTAQDWDLWYTQLSEHWKHTDSIVHLQDQRGFMLQQSNVVLGHIIFVCLCTFRWPLFHLLSLDPFLSNSTSCNRLVMRCRGCNS